MLDDVANRLEVEQHAFVELLVREAGKPIRFARTEVERAVTTLRIAAQEALRLGGEIVPMDFGRGIGKIAQTQRYAAGVILGFSPFNFPLNLALHFNEVFAKRYPGMPRNTLFLGLFQGALPSVLQEMTMVEQSMISLYSNLTRISLQAGVHYHAKPTVYTIVNDLTSVMVQLPNFVNINAYAILRHRTSNRFKHYQFRRNKVKDALVWLIKHNRQYRNVKTSYPTTVD
jgi:hypothetical protein